MNRNDFDAMRQRLFRDIDTLNERKGNDYSGNDNVFKNFEENAHRLDLDKYRVWGVYANKHLDAIFSWIRTKESKSEPIQSRIQDAITYLTILYAMVEQDQSTLHSTQDSTQDTLSPANTQVRSGGPFV